MSIEITPENIKEKFPELEFTDISQYFDRSRSYYINMIYKLYFLNKSFSAFDFVLNNNIKLDNSFLVQLDSSLSNDIQYNFGPISDVLIKSPSTFDTLISLFNNNPKAENFITDIYFPSQFAFFFCSFFQDKAKQFISEYINKSVNQKFVIRIAASFIRSSNKFRQSLLNTFIEIKAKMYAKSLEDINKEDKSQLSDYNILIQSFFDSLHLLTTYQYQILKQIVLKSKENATEMILKYILSPIIRNWEYSDYFVGTNLLFTNYENDDENNRCPLLKIIKQTTPETNQRLFNDFYSKYIDEDLVSHQDAILLEELINSKQLKFGFTSLELQINKILIEIFKSGNSTKESVQKMVDKFNSLLEQPKNLFIIKLFGEDVTFTNSEIPSLKKKSDPSIEENYLFFQKIKAQASETLQDFYDLYVYSLGNICGYNSDLEDITKSIICSQVAMNKMIDNAVEGCKSEIKFSQKQRKKIGKRMAKARLLKEEIKSAENIIDDLILKLIFKYNDHFNINELMNLSSNTISDEEIIIALTDDTSKFICDCMIKNDEILSGYIKDFLINCKNPEEILSFVVDKNEKYQSSFTQRDKILSIKNQTAMCIKFERAKAVYIFSNRKFNLIEGAKLSIKKEDFLPNVEQVKNALQRFSSFTNIGILLGNQISMPKIEKRGLYMTHFIKLMNIIIQIKFSIELNQKNNGIYFDDPQLSDISCMEKISFYLFILFVDPKLEIKNQESHENLLKIFQMFFGTCQLINTFIQQCKNNFKFIDYNIINTIKNSNKQISDELIHEKSKNDQQIDVANDFEYMLQYSEELMNINGCLLDYFIA